MKGLCILATLAAVIGVSVAKSSPVGHTFCKNYVCPEFVLLEMNEDYEVRQFKSAKWVSHGGTASPADMTGKMKQSFKLLLRYLQGADNDRNMRMPMTKPLVNMISCKNSDSCDYEVSVYIPYENAPNPVSSVNLKQWDPMTVYVRQVGGSPKTEEDFEKEVKILAAAINDPTKYDNTMYYRATWVEGETPPFKVRNEVWLLATQ